MTDQSTPWNHIQNDLQSALSTWEDLSAKVNVKLMPDQEQLQQIKNLLIEITLQMESFSSSDNQVTSVDLAPEAFPIR